MHVQPADHPFTFWLACYLASQVQLADISAKTCMFSLLGPQADAVMQQLQAAGIRGAPYGTHTLLSFRGVRQCPLHSLALCCSACLLIFPGAPFVCEHPTLDSIHSLLHCRQAGDCHVGRRPARPWLHFHRRRVGGNRCVACTDFSGGWYCRLLGCVLAASKQGVVHTLTSQVGRACITLCDGVPANAGGRGAIRR